MAVYLLHFTEPLAHARHYIGYTPGDLERRLDAHRRGQGAALTRAAVEHGAELLLARVWPDGDRELERRLKRWHKGRQLCPICRNGGRTDRVADQPDGASGLR